MDKQALIKDLQIIVTGLSQQADGHELEAIILKVVDLTNSLKNMKNTLPQKEDT